MPWSDVSIVPTRLLREELLRRGGDIRDERPECGTKDSRGSYNTPLHVFALFLILALSTAGEQHPIPS